MSNYALTLRNTRYSFADLREVMAKASPLRSGDCTWPASRPGATKNASRHGKRSWRTFRWPVFLQEPLVEYREG